MHLTMLNYDLFALASNKVLSTIKTKSNKYAETEFYQKTISHGIDATRSQHFLIFFFVSSFGANLR